MTKEEPEGKESPAGQGDRVGVGSVKTGDPAGALRCHCPDRVRV